MMILLCETDVPNCPCKVVKLDSEMNQTDESILIQTDWDYPGIASTFGWIPCTCGETDGTIDCSHHTVSEMIQNARQYIEDHIGDTVDDPGYFQNGGVPC